MSSQPAMITKYLSGWTASLAQLISQLTSEDWQAEAATAPADYLPIVSGKFSSPQMAGLQFALLGQSDVRMLLSIFLSEEVDLAPKLDAMQSEALEELLRQWCGLAATALKEQLGEVSLQVALQPEAESGPAQSAYILRVTSGARAINVVLRFDDALLAWLRAREPETPAAPAPAPSPPSASARVDELLREGNLELLMDVELPVMLRFGCREATLREVLDMATGAVLELDREIQEPVDLVLNGKVVARGEVVVIDGNYGLRVAEVATPRQRVSSL